MLAVPFLFIGGVVFGYFTVVPRAIEFLQNFNTDSFDVLIQAQPYYKFVLMLLMAMGLLFQIPVGIIAVTRVGIVSTSQLAHNRRYAILVIAVLAMLLPGQDPITMAMMMAPMYVLFEASILFSWLLDRRAGRAAAEDESPRTGARARHHRSGLVRVIPCCSIFEAAAAAAPSKPSTSPSRCSCSWASSASASVRAASRAASATCSAQNSGRAVTRTPVERLTSPGPDRRPPDQGHPDRRRGLGRARAGPRPARPGRRQLRLRGQRLHRRGPPPAGRGRHRVGQVRRARARRARRAPRPPDAARPSSRSTSPPRRSPPRRC